MDYLSDKMDIPHANCPPPQTFTDQAINLKTIEQCMSLFIETNILKCPSTPPLYVSIASYIHTY